MGLKPKRFYRHMDRQKAEQIRRLYFGRVHKQAELARMFGVKQNTISRIISGMVWT